MEKLLEGEKLKINKKIESFKNNLKRVKIIEI